MDKTVRIRYDYDPNNDMERLLIDDLYLGGGNCWDNHCDDRFDAVVKTLDFLKIPYEIIKNRKWDCGIG